MDGGRVRACMVRAQSLAVRRETEKRNASDWLSSTHQLRAIIGR